MAVYELVAYLHKICRLNRLNSLHPIALFQTFWRDLVGAVTSLFKLIKHILYCRIVFLSKFDCLLGFSRCQFSEIYTFL